MIKDMDLQFELDHIGIAVETLEKGSEFYRTLGFADMEVLPDHYGPGLDRHTMEATVDDAFRQKTTA